MCDDATEAESIAYLEKLRLSRRELGVGAGGALATAMVGCAANPAPAANSPPAANSAPAEAESPPASVTTASRSVSDPGAKDAAATISRKVTIDMPEGTAEAFFVAPQGGQHPGVLMWPDVAGLRDAFESMATRLARDGYAVLVVNQYYRSTRLPVLGSFAEWRTEAGKAKIQPMKERLTADAIARDAAAFIAWLDVQVEVDKARKLGSAGYCMGGPFTFRTAAAAPARVGAIASLHGGGLVTDEPSSPHTLFEKTKAAALICIAQNDHEREPEEMNTLRRAAAAANVPAEIDVYPAQHGWCVIDSPVYDEAQAERAWARMLATFQRYL